MNEMQENEGLPEVLPAETQLAPITVAQLPGFGIRQVYEKPLSLEALFQKLREANVPVVVEGFRVRINGEETTRMNVIVHPGDQVHLLQKVTGA